MVEGQRPSRQLLVPANLIVGRHSPSLVREANDGRQHAENVIINRVCVCMCVSARASPMPSFSSCKKENVLSVPCFATFVQDVDRSGRPIDGEARRATRVTALDTSQRSRAQYLTQQPPHLHSQQVAHRHQSRRSALLFALAFHLAPYRCRRWRPHPRRACPHPPPPPATIERCRPSKQQQHQRNLHGPRQGHWMGREQKACPAQYFCFTGSLLIRFVWASATHSRWCARMATQPSPP